MIEKDAETDRKKAVIEAEKEAQVAKIRFLAEIYSSSGKVINCCFGQIRAKHLGEGEHGYNGEDHGLHPLGQRAHKDGCRILQGDLTIQLMIKI